MYVDSEFVGGDNGKSIAVTQNVHAIKNVASAQCIAH